MAAARRSPGCGSGARSRRLAPRGASLAQRGGDQLLRVVALDPVEQPLGLERRVAEVDQAVASEATRVSLFRGRHDALVLQLSGDLLAQLDDDPLRGPLADPG